MVPALTVANAQDMYSRYVMATFKEQRRLKGKIFYGDYAVEETIAISFEDEDDLEFGKMLRSGFASPTTFVGNGRVKLEVLPMEEANAKMLGDEEQRVRLQQAAGKEPSVPNKIVELKELILEQTCQKMMAQPPSNAKLITQVLQGMMV